jgi:aspartate kinase
MAIIVQKYGGTSLSSIVKIKLAAKKVIEYKQLGHKVVVVVSAMAGETNRLANLIKEMSIAVNSPQSDLILSTGEQVSASLLCASIQNLDCIATVYTGTNIPIITNNCFSRARINRIDISSLIEDIESGKIPVVAGFQGKTEKGEITTLGRGGSDITAVALAAALEAEECQIYTDVSGVYTTDPKIVKDAKLLKHITLEEMLEMSSLGAKILHPRAVEFIAKHAVKVRVLHALENNQGTLITLDESPLMEERVVSGIAFSKDDALFTIKGIPNKTEYTYKLLNAMGKHHIDIDIIVQNTSSDAINDLTFTVHKEDFHRSKILLDKILPEIKASDIIYDINIAKVSVIGVGMRSHYGVAAQVFNTLAKSGISMKIISTSEIKVSVVIVDSLLDAAVQALHNSFKLHELSSPLIDSLAEVN